MDEKKNEPVIEGGPLLQEHGFLGAHLEPDETGLLVPAYYGDASGEPEAFDKGCALADVSGLVGIAVTGAGAESLCSMVFAGAMPEPGRILCTLALGGDGTVLAPVLLAHTAPGELACWTPAETASRLADWLRGIAAIEQDGQAPFAGVSFSPATPAMTTLALAGPKAPEVLDDYLAEGATLPEPGTIGPVTLDAIGAVMACLEAKDDRWYVVWVPDTKARVLWRSLLSFEEVVPVGMSAVWGRVGMEEPGIVDLVNDTEAAKTPAELGLQGLLRSGDDFIGARALREEADSAR